MASRRQISLTRLARHDLRTAAAWYATRQVNLDQKFLQAIATALNEILDRATSYPVVHEDMRRAMVKRFPYGIYFRLEDEVIQVLGFFHLHRDPEAWQRRI